MKPHRLLNLFVASAVAATAEAQQSAPDVIEQVVVTGSRIEGRTIENSAVPIDVVSSKDLVATGQVNVLRALESLLPSFQRSDAQSDVEKTHPGVKLRGLNPGYTLVLVNGKRRNVSAYVSPQTFPGQAYADLSLIPTSAVDHVEVLRDGASAIYGSDAVAGVFNIILKSNYSGGGLSAEWGQSYKGDGDRTNYAANFGLSLASKGFLNLSAEYAKQDNEYRIADYKPNNVFYPLVDASGNPVSKATYRTIPVLNAVSGDPYSTRLANANITNNTNALLLPTNADGSVRLPAGVFVNPRDLDRDLSWINTDSSTNGAYTMPIALAANLEYALTDKIDLYGFSTYTRKSASSRWGYRSPLKIWANNPALLEVYPEGFIPRIDTEETDYSIAGGLRSTVLGWETDASVTWNHDAIDLESNNTINLGQEYTSAAAGSVAQTDFFAGRLTYAQLIGNLDLRRAFEIGALASPLQASLGLEYQHEHYTRSAGDPLGYYKGTGGQQPYAQAYPSNRPEDTADQGRHGEAIYAGLAANVLPSWYVDVAVRYEDHSDYGSVSSGRLSTRWDITDVFGVRATVSNGFHAPGLGAQGFQVDKVTPTSHTLIAKVSSPVAIALGATPLRPEKSRNYSAGLTFNLPNGPRAAIDVYRIFIDGQLGISSAVGYDYSDAVNARVNGVNLSPAQKAAYDALLSGEFAIAPGDNASYQYFTNIGDFRYQGIEATIEDSWNLFGGRLRASYAFATSEVSVENVHAVPAQVLALYGQQQKTADSYASYNNSLPKWTQILNLAYSYGPWNFTLNEINNAPRRQAGVSVNGVTTYYKVDPTFVTNVSAGYRLQNGINLQIGAQNAFGARPDRLPADQVPATVATYTSYVTGTGLSLEGGRYYVRLDYQF